MADDPIDAIQEDFTTLMKALGKFRGSLTTYELRARGGMPIPPGFLDLQHLESILHQVDRTAGRVETMLESSFKEAALIPQRLVSQPFRSSMAIFRTEKE